MAKGQKNVTTGSPGENELPFAEALQKLESIVEAMESGDLPLEALMARAEEGFRLAQACQSKLAEAELKIQQLEKSAAGELSLKSIKPVDGTDES